MLIEISTPSKRLEPIGTFSSQIDIEEYEQAVTAPESKVLAFCTLLANQVRCSVSSDFGINPGTSTFLQEEAKLSLLNRIYHIPDKDKVLPPLTSQPELVQRLINAFLHIERYFPGDPLILKQVKDPEYATERMVVFIHTNKNPEDAFAAFKSLNRNWWIHEEKANQYFSITVSFQ